MINSAFPIDKIGRERLENMLTDFLFKHFNKFIDLDVAIVKGKFEVVGFHVVEEPSKK